MLTNFRSFYEKASIPFGKASARFGLTADHWTAFGVLAAVLAAAAFAQQRYWLGLAMVAVMNIADMLDGATARATGKTRLFGTVLDHSTDRYEEYLLVAGLLLGGAISPLLAMVVSSGIIMASYVRAKVESVSNLKQGAVGIAGRQEKLILLMASLVLFGLGLNGWANGAMWVLGIISHITAFQRLADAKKRMASPPAAGA